MSERLRERAHEPKEFAKSLELNPIRTKLFLIKSFILDPKFRTSKKNKSEYQVSRINVNYSILICSRSSEPDMKCDGSSNRGREGVGVERVIETIC